MPSHGVPLSFAQQRLWFLDQLRPGLAHYNLPLIFDIDGPLDVDVLQRCLDELLRRHDALRTVFADDVGIPRQVVLAPAPFDLACEDVSGEPPEAAAARVDDDILAEARRPFDLKHGPVFRARLVRLAATRHVLIGNIHHIAFDGWSSSILFRELAALYDAFSKGQPSPLPMPACRYADFAVQQRAWAETDACARQLAYWRHQLRAPLPLLALPADRPRPPVDSHRGHRAESFLPPATVAALEALGRAERSTLFMTLVAAYGTLLHRICGQDDVIIGTPIANRNRPEIEGTVGFFANSLALRLDLSGRPTFRELMARVRRTAIDAYANQDLPFDRLVEELNPERSLSHMPITQTFLVTDQAQLHGRTIAAADIVLRRRPVPTGTAKFDATLTFRREDGGRRVLLDSSADLFDAGTGEQILRDFCSLVGHLERHADERIDRVPMPGAAERRVAAVAGGPAMGAFAADETLVSLFEAQAAAAPDRDAVMWNRERLSYAELSSQAHGLAAALKARGVRPQERVGLCLTRSPLLLAAALGVLKAGAAYVPLDPVYPADRLRFIAADAGCRLVITDRSALALARSLADEPILAGGPAHEGISLSEAAACAPASLAYVIYTSGSTGRPKGVAVEHRQVINLLSWAKEVFTPGERAGMLASTSMSFDLSVFEWFLPLCTGGMVVLVDTLLALGDAPAREQVTFVNTVPSVMREFLRTGQLPASVSVVAMAGEPLPQPLVEQVYEQPGVKRVFDLYGPTETTVYATAALRTRGGATTIGRPIANTTALVLDDHGAPVVVGAAGELFIGGAGVARGYLNRDDLTRERFREDAGGPWFDGRMYRTGDRVRWRADGTLEFIGRVDRQIKLRGFRIEPGEIEAALHDVPGVLDAAVVMRGARPERAQLAACIVATAACTDAVLYEHLERRLPHYMVPARIVRVAALPRLPNGKVDYHSLEAAGDGPPPAHSRAPRTPVEQEVAEVWAQLLELPHVGVDDHFFRLGGHSLLATQLVLRVNRRCGVNLAIADAFAAPTIALQARLVEQQRTTAPGTVPSEVASTAERSAAIPPEWAGRSAPYPRDATVLALVERWAARTPDAEAIVTDSGGLTYAEIDARAARLAARIRGVVDHAPVPAGAAAGRTRRVGLCLPRSADAVVAMLAVWKARGAYVPLDPGLPAPRLSTLVREAGVCCVVTHTSCDGPFDGLARIDIDGGGGAAEPCDVMPEAGPGAAGDLAYILFTSGTTGVPKAVGVPHRAIVRLAYGLTDAPIAQGDTVLQLASLSFDASTFEIWCPLVHGARVALAPDACIASHELGRFVSAHRVTTMWLTSSLFNSVIDTQPGALAGVRRLLIGGEALSVPHVRRAMSALPALTLVNGYGPTEATTFAATFVVDAMPAEDAPAIPIGRPLLNTRVYVLDEDRRPVPAGHDGELWIGGDGLADGYVNDAALTAQRFVPDPFDGGGRMYRTGDRVRWRADGSLEFRGRLDDQVKLRGFRIEPGEVEAALAQQPEVRGCAVVAVARPSGPALEAFVVSSNDAAAGDREQLPGGLRDRLRGRLPEYMVPSRVHPVDALPLLATGKVDRRALAALALGMDDGPAGAPAHASEPVRRIREICLAVLQVPAIDLDDNFFDVGGHSLLATQVVSRIRTALSVDLDLRTFFETPTVRGLAAAVERLSGRPEVSGSIAPADRGGPLPLSYAQERIWFLHHWHRDSPVYNVPVAFRLEGRLDVDRLRRALQIVVDRHEALRTVFRLHEGGPVQEVFDALRLPFEVVDLQHLAGEPAEQAAAAAVRAEAARLFDLASGPLIHVVLIKLTATSSVLVLNLHHIVSDGWSLGVLLGELRALYSRPLSDTLPRLGVQYPDFAVWQRQQLTPARIEHHLRYWRGQLEPPLAALEWPGRTRAEDDTDARGASIAVTLPETLSRGVAQTAAAGLTTPFAVLIAAFQAVLSRHTGQEDVCVGTPVANRTAGDLEPLIGCFVNTLVMRGDLSGRPTLQELLERTRRCAVAAQSHQDLPFELVVDALHVPRRADRSPLFQAMFVLNDGLGVAPALDNVAMKPYRVALEHAKFDVSLSVHSTPAGIRGSLDYRVGLIERDEAATIVSDWIAMLDAMTNRPDMCVADVPLAGAAGRPRRRIDGLAPAPPLSEGSVTGSPDDAVLAPIEHQLKALWCDLLQIADITTSDDFFDVGGNSLLAVRLFSDLEQRFGVRLPLSTLFRNGTIRAQAGLIARGAAQAAWSVLVPLQPLGERPPFFLVHGIGGEVLSFAQLARNLAPAQPLIAIQAERDRIGADDRLEAVAARYVEEIRTARPRGPYFLGGYSAGGLIAYEMAQQLAAAGQPVALLAMIDASAPGAAGVPLTPYTLWRMVKNAAYWTLDDSFLRSGLASQRERVSSKLRSMRARRRGQGTRAAIEAGADVRDLLGVWKVPPHARRFLERYVRMMQDYRPRPYRGTVTLLRARTMSLAYTGADDLGWGPFAERVVVRHVAGAHDTILKEPRVGVLAQLLLGELAACQDAAEA